MDKETNMRKDIEIRLLSKGQDCENYIRIQKEVSLFRHAVVAVYMRIIFTGQDGAGMDLGVSSVGG